MPGLSQGILLEVCASLERRAEATHSWLTLEWWLPHETSRYLYEVCLQELVGCCESRRIGEQRTAADNLGFLEGVCDNTTASKDSLQSAVSGRVQVLIGYVR